MGRIYKVDIEFLKEKHCLNCPIRSKTDDTCNLQEIDGENLIYASWASQMEGCPLRFVKEVE
ncbi:MAG: hypothetical protein WCS56_06355 [Bacilli bacterium]|jgi:hypothetical protein